MMNPISSQYAVSLTQPNGRSGDSGSSCGDTAQLAALNTPVCWMRKFPISSINAIKGDAMDIDLSQFDQIWLNLSGGKDSQTLALQMVDLAGRQGVCGRLRAVHSDTGAEWSCTRSVVQDLCRRLEIPLEIVTPKVTIPEYIEKRQYFPSMRCRFCTSIKTGAIDKLIRKYNPFRQESKVLCVTGERREESPKRSKLAEFEVHKTLTAGKRQVFRYRPLLDWKEGQIWDAIKKSGIPAHPAYTEYGNERLSCALCIFACDQDLRNGAMNRPDLAERYLKVERESGFLFREKRSLRQILYPRTDEDDLFAWAEKAAV